MEKLKKLCNRLKDEAYYTVFFWKKKKKEKYGFKQEIKDWLGAFIVAAVVYFIILPALLGSSSPAVVVSSCSERGYLNIGDVLLVQGMRIENLRAPSASVDRYAGFVPIFEGKEVTALNISGQIVNLDRTSDVIVYNSPRGQIIHRAFVKINVSGTWLVITKGDANAIPDQMVMDASGRYGVCIDELDGCISTPVTQRMLVGKQFGWSAPILGHVKLFFCDVTLGALCEGHSNMGTNHAYMLTC
jgi:signal peptidase I